jgi:hypothetical protein
MSLEVLETNSTAYACSIKPYLSSDDQALTPVAYLCGHCIHQHFHAVADVGGLLFLVNCCRCNSGDVLAKLIAMM